MALTKVKLIADGTIVQSHLNASHGITTADIGENASYLYYTDARARAAVSVSGNALSYNSSTGVITSNYEESPTFTGDVLIGTSTTTPSTHYNNLVIEDVAGNNVGISLISSTGNNTALYFGDSADTDVGQLKYSHATNDMFFVVNASTAMTIDSSGSVGIGQTSPNAKLEIYGTANSSPQTTNDGILKINSTSTNAIIFGTLNSSPFGTYIQSGGSNVYPLILNPNGGNVGIGTVSPNAFTNQTSLTINGTNNGRLDLKVGNAQKGAVIASANEMILDAGASPMQFYTGSTLHMLINTSGNVGIGITTPGTLHSVSYGTTKLHIDGGTDRGQIILEGDTLANIVMSDNGATANSRVFLAQVNDGLMHFKSVNDNGTSKATIMSMTSSGNVGIGTTNPQENLHIADPSDGIPVFRLEGSSRAYQQYVSGTSFYIRDVTGSSNRITLDSSGNVGIGTTSPRSITNHTSLTINGTSVGRVDLAYGGTISASLYSNNSATGLQTESALPLVFGTDETERMRINSSGYVGIGTTNPLQNFVVAEGTGQHGIELVPGTLSYIQAYDRATSDYGDLKIDAETIQFGTNNGSERMRIDSSGNVGISNTNPSSYYANANNLVVGSHTGSNGISILSATNSTGWLIFADSTAGGDNTRGAIAYDHSTNSMSMRVNNDTKMLIDSSGNVGISYTGPYNQISGGETTLAIADAENAALYLKSNAAGGHNHILFSGTGGALSFYDKTRGDYNMVIDGSGNVGIGETSPSTNLHIKGASSAASKIRLQANASNDYDSILEFADNVSVRGSVLYSNYTNHLAFSTNSSERMRIDSSGNLTLNNGAVTLNESNGTYIDIRNNNSTRGYLGVAHRIITGGGTTDLGITATTNLIFGSGGSTERMRIDTSGNVGIGTTSPSQKLDVSGIVKQNGANNYENILVKSGSTGTFTFTQTELNSQMVDNVSYFIFVSVYRPTTDVTNDVGTLLLHGIMPRGSNSTFNTINTLKGSGISVLSATNSNNSLVITTDSGTTFRCAIRIIAMGGTS